MLPRIVQAVPTGNYRLWLMFSDGLEAEVDLQQVVTGRGGVFEAFESRAFFAEVRVDHEAGTVVWPNDVDLCPDVLYGLATGRAPVTASPAVAVG